MANLFPKNYSIDKPINPIQIDMPLNTMRGSLFTMY